MSKSCLMAMLLHATSMLVDLRAHGNGDAQWTMSCQSLLDRMQCTMSSLPVWPSGWLSDLHWMP